MKADGKKVPELENRPEVKGEYFWIWDIYISLHNQRQAGMAINPISIEAMARYFEMFDITGEEREFLFEVISKIDTAWVQKKQKEINDG